MKNYDDSEIPLDPKDDWDLPQEATHEPVAKVAVAGPALRGELAVLEEKPTMKSAVVPSLSARPVQPFALCHRSKIDHFPAITARSGLFRVGGLRKDEEDHSGPVKAQGAYDLSLFGPRPRPRMRDKQVWEAAIGLAKESEDLSAPLPVVLSEIAARMGWSDKSGASLDWIWSSLERLACARIEFVAPNGKRCSGSLLASAKKIAGKRTIQVDPDLAAALFCDDYQFRFQPLRRGTLSSSLGQWLHDFLSTHNLQSDMLTVGHVRELSGHPGDKRRFPELLRAALSELVEKAPTLLAGFELKKEKRSSDFWRIQLQPGTDKPVFAKPNSCHSHAKPAPSTSTSTKGRSRTRLAL